ncbi:MAG: hypothetical protein LBV12_04165 [Puniceicoccales bacterium]|jgi:hypothetical protein|nr:hypothetical protein [Puniceicoccales bacterium]
MRLVLLLLLALSFTVSSKASVIIETADGLPVEVDIISIYRNEVQIRYKVSKREAKLDLTKLPDKTQKEIAEEVEKKRKSIKAIFFNAGMEENPSPTKELAVKQKGYLNASEIGRISDTKIIRPGGRYVRIRASTDAGVDVPLHVTIYWYAQMPGRPTWSMEEPEEVTLNPTATTSEYVSRSPGFARNAYRGFAIIAKNPANGEIVGRASSSASYMQDAEARAEAKK